MKQKSILIIPLVCALLLTSCGKKEETATIGPAIFTSVAETLTAQYTPQDATETPLPTESPTEYVEPTAFATQAFDYFPTATTTTCDNSAYVDDITYDDGTNVSPDTEFTKTWELRNTGTCTWTSTYKLKFVSGSQMDGTTTEIGETVNPGDTIQISVDMVSPSSSGTYTGYWRMVNDGGTFFGTSINVTIVVSTTATPTITKTPTVTKTSAATNTPWIITATFTSTDTPTSTDTTEASTSETEDPG